MKSTNHWYQAEVDELLGDLLVLNERKALVSLLNKIATPRELNDMARRLKGCKMLQAGKSYSEIRDRLGLGDATIAKLSAHVGYGFRRSYARVGDPKARARKRAVTVMPNYKGAPGIKIKI